MTTAKVFVIVILNLPLHCPEILEEMFVNFERNIVQVGQDSNGQLLQMYENLCWICLNTWIHKFYKCSRSSFFGLTCIHFNYLNIYSALYFSPIHFIYLFIILWLILIYQMFSPCPSFWTENLSGCRRCKYWPSTRL